MGRHFGTGRDVHHHRRTGLVRRRDGRTTRLGHVRSDGVGPGRRARWRQRSLDRRLADRSRRMNALWSDEAGDVERPLIALVHGSMDRSAGMLKLSRRLDAEFRVLRYDRRGYGRSFPHPGPFTMGGQVDDLVQLLAGRRAVLIGHSYGGDVALATADRHPDLIAGVAGFETPVSRPPRGAHNKAGGLPLAPPRRNPEAG